VITLNQKLALSRSPDPMTQNIPVAFPDRRQHHVDGSIFNLAFPAHLDVDGIQIDNHIQAC